MSLDWPREVIRAVALRRVVLFLGAGVSRNSTNLAGARPKLWAEFLLGAIDQCTGTKTFKNAVKAVLRSGDLLMACEIIKARFPPGGFNEFCRQEFVVPQFRHAPIHEALGALDCRIVATPNFDKIYETYINHVQHNSVTVKVYNDGDVAEIVRSESRFVLKVHGTIDSPGEMIFTRSDYAKARNEHSAFYSLLGSLLTTHTFLFIGCGLDDPDVKLLLEDYTFSFPSILPHYFVTSRDNTAYRFRDAYERGLGVRFVGYDPSNGHLELTEGLKALGPLVQTERESIAKLGNW